MKLRIPIVLALFCIFCAVTSTSAQNKTDDAVLQDLVRQVVNAQGAYDISALEKLTTADYIEISPLGEVDPREKMLSFYKPELKPKNLEIKSDADEISIRNYGKFAIVIARLNYSITMEGKTAPPRSIRVTYVFRKEKDAWKIASAHFTSIRPAAPQPK